MQLLGGILSFILVCYIVMKTLHNKKQQQQQIAKKEASEQLTKLQENSEGEVQNKEAPDPLFEEVPPPPTKAKAVDTEAKKQTTIAKSPSAQDYLALYIMPKHRDLLPGRLLLTTLKTNGFVLGKQKIFHCYEENDPSKRVLFSIASAREPGIFDEKAMNNLNYQGVTLFMLVSDHKEPKTVFDNMLKTARKIAVSLNGELHDSQHRLLSAKSLKNYQALLAKKAESEKEPEMV